ncbi:molecular chaperone [Lysobacter sp. KIS68-7]|uniref:fimbrial biogenesis chaperone n=1 Tax=Lysobacter sp. KIS68-7 TaxID=2904252 RepID=UPI001E52F2AF|nr:molecular chaperone [Lysobacter sp. KIS68-7]UHQ19465.1 molecular chaperone [Lysobacter sp. KIS68-7]
MHASVVVSSTRVIYPADAQDITVRLTNRRPVPALVEAWIEHDGAHATSGVVPFAITPPLFRLDAGKGQALRVHRLPAPLSSDRESLFWLNVLDVPADAPRVVDGTALKMAVRSKLKLFVRPPGLAGSANRAPGRLTWRLVEDDGVPELRIDNPTPFHVTISRVLVGGALDFRGDMVAPFGQLALSLEAVNLAGAAIEARVRADALRAAGRVEFHSVDDAGGLVPHTARVGHGAR